MFFLSLCLESIYIVCFQIGETFKKAEIGKREKARLKEMQRMKKHKIQELLDAQNASIEADMVCEYHNAEYHF